MDDLTLRAAFEKFHAENPRIYALLCRFADEIAAAGLSSYGVAAVFERIRWHVRVETRGGEFKLNNNHRSFYARLWLAEHPDRSSFFETRTLRSEPPEPGAYGRGAA